MAQKSLLGRFPLPAAFDDRLQEWRVPWWLKYIAVAVILWLVAGFVLDMIAGPVQPGATNYDPLIITSRLAYAYALIFAVGGVLLVLGSLALRILE